MVYSGQGYIADYKITVSHLKINSNNALTEVLTKVSHGGGVYFTLFIAVGFCNLWIRLSLW